MFLHGSVSLQLFPVVWIFLRSLGVICYDRLVLGEGHKNYFRDWCLINSQPTVILFNLFKLNELWPCYQKGLLCKPDNFESHNSLKLSFKYSKPSLEFCWLQIFPWIKLSWHSCSVWHKSGWLNWFWQFLCERLSSFNPKGFWCFLLHGTCL